jgi:cation diffusion facilitator family transporter
VTTPKQSSENRRKERVALWSIAASVFITLTKGAAGLATGSLALIADAAHSLLDVAATSMTWLAVRAAHKPADEEHHYGHGKYEALAALAETAFLFLLSGAVAFEGVRRLLSGTGDIEPSWIAAGILVLAIGIDAWRWWTLKKVSKETGSEALDADALHFSSDLVNSLLVLAALGAAALGYPQADSLVAVGVSLFIALAGFRLAQRTINTLLDAAPKGLAARISDLAERVPGVVEVERVRVRTSGGHILGEVLVRVSRTLPLENVAAIKLQVAEAVEQDLPRTEVTVTAEPIQLDDETMLERVTLIAARRHLPVHHVVVQELGQKLSLSLDLEVDGRLTLSAAHDAATKLEAAIRDELGPEVEVDTHIEPLRVGSLAGVDERGDLAERIAAGLRAVAKEIGEVRDVHSVRVRRTADGLVVNYHCRMDPTLSVSSVHAHVDELERRIRVEYPEILRVIGHAEPIDHAPH